MAQMIGQEIVIYIQNMMSYRKFLMAHPSFGITKHMNRLVYIIKISSKSIIKCILVNDGRNNKKSILLKPLLYPSWYQVIKQ